MIEPLAVASDGVLGSGPLSIASGGFLAVTVYVRNPFIMGGGVQQRTAIVEREGLVPWHRLVREDEEILAVVVAAVQAGVL